MCVRMRGNNLSKLRSYEIHQNFNPIVIFLIMGDNIVDDFLNIPACQKTSGHFVFIPIMTS